MNWELSHRFDPRAVKLANRHYNRQKPLTNQFVPPGRCIVLLSTNADALWTSSFPMFARHAWVGSWVCTLFRNESPILSSKLITEALAVTRWLWGEPPSLGMITFINPARIKPTQKPGWCFRKAGWKEIGQTQIHKLITLQIAPEQMPDPSPPHTYQMSLFHEF